MKIKFMTLVKDAGGRYDDMIFGKWRDTRYVRPFVKSDKEPTEAQIRIRMCFTAMVEGWGTLTGVVRRSWEAYAEKRNQTGYNAFIGANVKRYRDNEMLVLAQPYGMAALENFAIAPGSAAGSIACSFAQVNGGGRVVLFTRPAGSDAGSCRFARHECPEGVAAPYEIAGLEAGREYQVYGIVTDDAYADAKKNSVSVGAISLAG